MIEPVQYAARPLGWFAVEGAVAAATAAFVASQALLLVAAGDNVHSWGSATVSSVAIAVGAGFWALLVGLVGRAVLGRLGQWDERSARERGFAVLHVVGIGTAVPWIVLALVLGSWQATTITIVVAVVAGAAAAWFAARHLWSEERHEALAR